MTWGLQKESGEIKREKCCIAGMPINTAHGQPVGDWIADGRHKPFRAPGCPLKALEYDESQMQENDGEKRAQRAALLYDC